eukprot:g223.t1
MWLLLLLLGEAEVHGSYFLSVPCLPFEKGVTFLLPVENISKREVRLRVSSPFHKHTTPEVVVTGDLYNATHLLVNGSKIDENFPSAGLQNETGANLFLGVSYDSKVFDIPFYPPPTAWSMSHDLFGMNGWDEPVLTFINCSSFAFPQTFSGRIAVKWNSRDPKYNCPQVQYVMLSNCLLSLHAEAWVCPAGTMISTSVSFNQGGHWHDTGINVPLVERPPLRIGLLYPQKISSSTWSSNNNEGRLWLQKKYRTAILTHYFDGGYDSTDANVGKNLALRLINEYNCTFMVMASINFIPITKELAKIYPHVKYLITSSLRVDLPKSLGEPYPNVAFGSSRMWEAMYVAGIAAGAASRTRKIAFLQTLTHPSTFAMANAFFMGARTTCSDCLMDVWRLNTFIDYWIESNAVDDLVARGNDVFLNMGATKDIGDKLVQQHKKVVVFQTIRDEQDNFLTSTLYQFGPVFDVFVQRIIRNQVFAGSEMVGLADDSCALGPLSQSVDAYTNDLISREMRRIDDRDISGGEPVFCLRRPETIPEHGPLIGFDAWTLDNGSVLPRNSTDPCLTQSEVFNMDWFLDGVTFLGDYIAPPKPAPQHEGVHAEELWTIIGTVMGSLLFTLFFVWLVISVYRWRGKLIGGKELADSQSTFAYRFLSSMSHEIRTPLNGILGSLEILYSTKLGDFQKDCMADIQSSSHHLMALVNDILDYSRFRTGTYQLDPEPCLLRALVDDGVQLVSHKMKTKDIAQMVLRGNPSVIVADRLRMKQILSNLVSNAFKFSEKEIFVLVDSLPRRKLQRAGDFLWSKLEHGDLGSLALYVSEHGSIVEAMERRGKSHNYIRDKDRSCRLGWEERPESKKEQRKNAGSSDKDNRWWLRLRRQALPPPTRSARNTSNSTTLSRHEASSPADETMLLFAIGDDGIGIALDAQKKLFQPFQQAVKAGSYGGSGLGLNICKLLIDKMNGELWLRSKPGHGTIMFCAVPAIDGLAFSHYHADRDGQTDLANHIPTNRESTGLYPGEQASLRNYQGIPLKKGEFVPLREQPLRVLVTVTKKLHRTAVVELLRQFGCNVHVASHMLFSSGSRGGTTPAHASTNNPHLSFQELPKEPGGGAAAMFGASVSTAATSHEKNADSLSSSVTDLASPSAFTSSNTASGLLSSAGPVGSQTDKKQARSKGLLQSMSSSWSGRRDVSLKSEAAWEQAIPRRFRFHTAGSECTPKDDHQVTLNVCPPIDQERMEPSKSADLEPSEAGEFVDPTLTLQELASQRFDVIVSDSQTLPKLHIPLSALFAPSSFAPFSSSAPPLEMTASPQHDSPYLFEHVPRVVIDWDADQTTRPTYPFQVQLLYQPLRCHLVYKALQASIDPRHYHFEHDASINPQHYHFEHDVAALTRHSHSISHDPTGIGESRRHLPQMSGNATDQANPYCFNEVAGAWPLATRMMQTESRESRSLPMSVAASREQSSSGLQKETTSSKSLPSSPRQESKKMTFLSQSFPSTLPPTTTTTSSTTITITSTTSSTTIYPSLPTTLSLSPPVNSSSSNNAPTNSNNRESPLSSSPQSPFLTLPTLHLAGADQTVIQTPLALAHTLGGKLLERPSEEITRAARQPPGRNKMDSKTKEEAAAVAVTVDRSSTSGSTETSPEKPLRILLADDVALNRKLGLRILHLLKYTNVETAENGEEALHKAQNSVFGLILMDVTMPVMDGLEATRQICATVPIDRRPFIVAVTANAMKEDRDMAMEAGCDDFMPKPFTKKQLSRLLQKWETKLSQTRPGHRGNGANPPGKPGQPAVTVDKSGAGGATSQPDRAEDGKSATGMPRPRQRSRSGRSTRMARRHTEETESSTNQDALNTVEFSSRTSTPSSQTYRISNAPPHSSIISYPDKDKAQSVRGSLPSQTSSSVSFSLSSSSSSASSSSASSSAGTLSEEYEDKKEGRERPEVKVSTDNTSSQPNSPRPGSSSNTPKRNSSFFELTPASRVRPLTPPASRVRPLTPTGSAKRGGLKASSPKGSHPNLASLFQPSTLMHQEKGQMQPPLTRTQSGPSSSRNGSHPNLESLVQAALLPSLIQWDSPLPNKAGKQKPVLWNTKARSSASSTGSQSSEISSFSDSLTPRLDPVDAPLTESDLRPEGPLGSGESPDLPARTKREYDKGSPGPSHKQMYNTQAISA